MSYTSPTLKPLATSYETPNYGPMPSAAQLSWGTPSGSPNTSSFGLSPSMPAMTGFGAGGVSLPSATDLSFGDPAALTGLTSTLGNTGANTGGWFTNADGSLDLGAIGGIVQGIGALGGLYTGWQANKLAKESLAFQKSAWKENLANQIKSFNLALEDRMRARYAQNEGDPAERDAYIARHRIGS